MVRTTAEVRHHSFESVPDAGMEGNLVVERSVSGELVGSAVVDTALGLRALGADSAAWEGVATLHTQDGRSFEAPLWYERVRSWRLADSTEWAALQDSLRAERRRQRTGMMILPVTELQERLASGDSTVVDSLRTRWRETGDPDERATVEGLLRAWGGRAPGRRDEILTWLDNVRLEIGDTATLLADRLDGGSWLDSLTEEDLDDLLPYLDDLGRLWEIGVTPRWTYSTLATGLLDDTPILEPDTAQWNCAPAACERVISLLETASEPRLRDVALVAAFARDPAAWYEPLRTRAESGSLVVREALRMGDGVGATWPAARGDPVPPPGASWRVWLSWMGGEVRFQSSHANALRMYEARTGRDVVGELSRGWPVPEDSAKAVLGTILREMGELDPPTLEQLADELLSGSIARVRAARSQLFTRVPPGRIRGEAADSLVAPAGVLAEVLPALLDSLMAEGRSPWPGVGPEGTIDPSVALYLGGFHGVRDVPFFLLDENLPPGFAPDVGAGFEPIDQETWDARPPREGGVLLGVSPLTAVGPFVSLAWDWVVFERRGPDEAPSGYAGGGTVWLLRRNGGWTVVSTLGWIT
jgi:hypothetical protein